MFTTQQAIAQQPVSQKPAFSARNELPFAAWRFRPTASSADSAKNRTPQPDADQDLTSAFADSGGLVNGSDLADMLRLAPHGADAAAVSQPVSQVARWIVSRQALAFSTGNGWVLPLFQFELPTILLRREMGPLLAELQGVLSGTELALWFVKPNRWLHSQRPALVMRKDLDAALQAARAERLAA